MLAEEWGFWECDSDFKPQTYAMKTIAQVSKPEDAHLIRLRLEAGGVEAFIQNEYMVSAYWLYSNATGGVCVDVMDEDYEQAREILELPPVDKGLITCPHCGSDKVALRELSMTGALSLALGFLLPAPSRQADCSACGKSFKVSSR